MRPGHEPPAGTRRFRGSRAEALRLTAGCGVFVAIGLWLASRSPGASWAIDGGVVFFGLGVIVGLLQLLPGSTYLEPGREGMVVCTFFRRWSVKWTEVERFDVGRVGGASMVTFTGSEAARAPAWLRRAVRDVTGTESALPLGYGLPPQDLAALLNACRDRAALPETVD